MNLDCLSLKGSIWYQTDRNMGRNSASTDGEEDSSFCQIINTCVKYNAQPGWVNYDLMATFPPLESPQIDTDLSQTKLASERDHPYFQFGYDPNQNGRPNFLIPVYAVIDQYRYVQTCTH